MFLNSYLYSIFILLIVDVTIFGDAQIKNYTNYADKNANGSLSEYSEEKSSYKITANDTNEFQTTELEEYDHVNDGDSWETWILSLLGRFSGTITCIVVICVVFCIFCSLHCILAVREPSWFAYENVSSRSLAMTCCSDMCIW